MGGWVASGFVSGHELHDVSNLMLVVSMVVTPVHGQGDLLLESGLATGVVAESVAELEMAHAILEGGMGLAVAGWVEQGCLCGFVGRFVLG